MFDVWRIFKIWTQYLKHSYQFQYRAFMTDEKELSLMNNFNKIEFQKGPTRDSEEKISNVLHFSFKSNQKPLFIHITSFYGLSDAWVKYNLNWENWFIFFENFFGFIKRLTEGKIPSVIDEFNIEYNERPEIFIFQKIWVSFN